MKSLTVTILGCGSSGGVPRVGNDWGVCDPSNPKNRRSRCGMHVTASFGESLPDYSFLIDTSPDLREQLIRNEISRVNSVLYTHDHADQTHGIDDIRVLAYMMRAQLPVYGMKETLAESEGLTGPKGAIDSRQIEKDLWVEMYKIMSDVVDQSGNEIEIARAEFNQIMEKYDGDEKPEHLIKALDQLIKLDDAHEKLVYSQQNKLKEIA